LKTNRNDAANETENNEAENEAEKVFLSLKSLKFRFLRHMLKWKQLTQQH
jgi:hypothetical protein